MSLANPLWGAPRIHGELLKLGFDISQRSVARLMPRRTKPPSQSWKTFLANHVADLASVDFLVVPTATFRILFVFVVLVQYRRRVVHWSVTENPTAAWTAQQIVEAFPEDSAPSYLLRDRDAIYGEVFQKRVKSLAIEQVLTSPRSPWQNPFAERLIGSIRRELLDHVIVLGERHLRPRLDGYATTTARARTSPWRRTPPRPGPSSRRSSAAWLPLPSRWPSSPLRPPGGVASLDDVGGGMRLLARRGVSFDSSAHRHSPPITPYASASLPLFPGSRTRRDRFLANDRYSPIGSPLLSP